MINFQNVGFIDLIGMGVGFLFTISVLSYMFGDNVLFRLATSVFIGVAVGIAIVAAWSNVVLPQLILPLIKESGMIQYNIIIPWFLSILIILKLFPRLSRLGNPSMALLVGVGVAAIIGGAINGTIFPQILSSINLFDFNHNTSTNFQNIGHLVEGVVILFVTLTTLIYFHFSVSRKSKNTNNRPVIVNGIAKFGKLFITIALAVLFSGILSATITIFIERITYLWDVITIMF